MTDIHTEAQCKIKLVALLNKLESIDTSESATLRFEVDDAKALAAELAREREFIQPD